MEQRACFIDKDRTSHIEKQVNSTIEQWASQGWRLFHSVADRNNLILFFERPRPNIPPPAPVLR
jgi:hypothetical protein